MASVSMKKCHRLLRETEGFFAMQRNRHKWLITISRIPDQAAIFFAPRHEELA